MPEPLPYTRVLLTQHQRPSGWALWIALVAAGVVAVVFASILLFPPRPTPWPVGLLLCAGLAFIVTLVLVPRLTVVVTSQELIVRLVPFWGTRIPVDEIAEARVDEFRPIREFGGWGIRWLLRDSSTCYTVAGTRGVRIVTTRNRKYLVGSPDADALLRAIESARQAT